MITAAVFYLFAGLLVLSAIAVVTMRNIFHSALALTAALSAVAGLFILVGADFLASSQILIYVGGIMIIMLFVVMFSQQPLDAIQRQTNEKGWAGFFVALFLAITLVRVLGASFRQATPVPGAFEPTSASIGRLLLGDMIVPFEVVSLVLLAALVGAVLFSQDKKESQ